MGWNGSDKPVGIRSSGHCPVCRYRCRPIFYMGFILLIVCIVSIAAIIMFRLGELKETCGQADSFEAKNVGNFHVDHVMKNRVHSQYKNEKKASLTRPEIEYAALSVKPHYKGRLIKWKSYVDPIFTNTADNVLYSLVRIIPGERFFASEVPEDFDELFSAALKHEIIIDPEDSEDLADLKRAVIEAREEIRKGLLEGRSARDIVQAAQDELNRIADYRDQVQEAFNKYLAKETDAKELLKYANEANTLLEEYGSMPIEAPDDEETALEMMIDAKNDTLSNLDKENSEPTEKNNETNL